MAIFNDVRDVERTTGRTGESFKRTKGWRKHALTVLGYNDDGTKNTYGKYFGHGNVLLDHYVPRVLATGDSKEVIKSGEGDSWNNQVASGQYATNFVGGGLGSGISSMFKKDNKVGTEVVGNDNINGGVQSGIKTDTSSLNNIKQLYSTKKNDEALAKLNYNVNSYEDNKSINDDSIIDESSYINDDSLYNEDKESLLKEEDYVNLDENGNVIEDSDEKEISKLGKVSEATNNIPVIGSLIGGAIGVKQNELITANNLKNKKTEVRRRKSLIKPSKQNYL